ncbi:MAG TPA: sulfatase-like hydrolase/transferase [Dokdonella sp.]|nr:sulfatase-like hydrolase/transferase [Dokdonella sp.]
MQPETVRQIPGAGTTETSESTRLVRQARRLRRLRIFAVIAFLAMMVLVPLTEKLVLEKYFAVAVVLAFTLALVFATARMAFFLLVPAIFVTALATASMLKFEFLLTPVLAPDLEYYLNLQTLELVGRYPVLLAFTVALVAVVPLLLIPAWRWERVPAELRPRRAGVVVLRMLGTVASAAILAVCLAPAGPFHGVFNKPMWATITDRSYLTAFFTSFSDTEVRLPAMPTHVDRSIKWKLDKPLKAPQKRPDVIAILEESTFDPHMLDVCTIPQCDLPMFKADAHTRAGGPLTVHTFGGGTWTSEFALETGLADVLFGNAGLYAPYSLAPRVVHTLPRAFKAAGYRVIAVYSHSGEFLNARNAYANYGYDMFYDGTDLGLGWKSTDADLLKAFRQIYSDETEAHPDQPLFIFTLTLHQHGPHMTPLEELPAPFDKPLFRGKFKPPELDDWLNLNLGNYLQRAALSSQMLDELESMLWASGRATVLMHFGDHQPSFDGAMHAIPKTVPKAAGPNDSRVTYYMLKTSFPMAKMPSYDALDIVYLGSMLLEAAGVPKDDFYQANSLLRDRCKGRYLTCKDSNVLGSYHDYLFNTLKDLRDEE